MEINQANYDLFWKMMYQRQEIWYRRFVQKLPKEKWYEGIDPIFQEFKFTNVSRRQDRNSVFLIENITKRKNTTNKDILFNIFLFRIFNRIETYQSIGFTTVEEYSYSRIYDTLKSINDSKEPVFTGAYMINGSLRPETKLKFEKYLLTIRDIHNDIDIIYDIVKNKTPEDIMNKMIEYPGIAEFTAYEFYCDICYCSFSKWTENEFCNIGPGCFKGLRFVYPNIKKEECKPILWGMYCKYKEEFRRLKLDFKYYDEKELTLRDIEHATCEFSKFIRYKLGGFRPKMKFVPISENNLYDKKEKDPWE